MFIKPKVPRSIIMGLSWSVMKMAYVDWLMASIHACIIVMTQDTQIHNGKSTANIKLKCNIAVNIKLCEI